MFKKIIGQACAAGWAASLVLILLSGAVFAAPILNVAVPADPDSFDPTQTVAAATGEIAFNIYEGLVKASPSGGITGALAEKWTVDAGNTVYTFFLRDALFHDGTPVTAADVVNALDRARDPKIAVRAGELAVIKEIREQNGAIRIELHEPHGAFLYTLAEVFAAVYPAGAANLARRPIGTGPYYLADWKPNQELTLRRFEQHWSGELPYYATAKFLIIPDENSAVLNLKAGRVDLIPRLEASLLHQIENAGQLKVFSSPMNVVQVLAINNGREPFTDWRVRRALALAVNRGEVIAGAAWGHGIPLYSGISPAMDNFFNADLAQINPYDPDLARRLLKEAGHENLRFSLVLPANYAIHVQTGELVAEQWRAIGVQVDLQIVEWGTWLERVYTQRDYDVSIIGLAGRLDPHAILVRYTTGNSRNFFNFSDTRYDELIAEGLRAAGEKRRDIYLAAQEILAQRLPGIFIMDPPLLAAMAEEIKGWQYYPTYVVDLARLYQ